MKKTIITTGLMALLTAACTNLDVDVQSQLTSYPDSEIAIQATYSDVYNTIRAAVGRRFDEGASCNSDEYVGVSFGGNWLNGRDCANFSTHALNASANAAQLDTYTEFQSAITKCNQAFIDLGLDEDSEDAAPLRAARAYYTFILMDYWGDTPIIDHLLDEDEAIDRSPRADVAKWIESELLDVREKCTTEVSTATYGSPTRWMCDALLAKLYINWNVYTQDVTSSSWSATATNEKLADCVAMCDDIIQAGLYDLSDDYKEKFLYNNGSHIKDFIWALPFDAANDDGGMTYARHRTWRKGKDDNNGNAGLFSIAFASSLGGNMALNGDFAKLFCLEGDRRNDCIVGDGTQETTDIYVYDAITAEKTDARSYYDGEAVVFYRDIKLDVEDLDLDVSNTVYGDAQGYCSIKFAPYVTEYNLYSRKQSNDMPLFRYADVILMKCEAIVRGASATNGDTALSLFNQIRSYVNAPLLESTPTLQEILDERGREFLDEHWRRNDLIRFGDFEREWGFKYLNPNHADLTNRLWPLSVNVLNTNTNWSQNAGY